VLLLIEYEIVYEDYRLGMDAPSTPEFRAF
jgi:hypothetical protein